MAVKTIFDREEKKKPECVTLNRRRCKLSSLFLRIWHHRRTKPQQKTRSTSWNGKNTVIVRTGFSGCLGRAFTYKHLIFRLNNYSVHHSSPSRLWRCCFYIFCETQLSKMCAIIASRMKNLFVPMEQKTAARA